MEEKLYDFWDACRIVAGTERRIRYDGRNWMSCLVRNNCQAAYLLSTNTANDWRPSLEQQEEKVWQVETEDKEISMTVTVSGKQVYLSAGRPGINIVRATPEQILSWVKSEINGQVKIEPEEVEEVFFWGVSQPSGVSGLFCKEPRKDSCGNWVSTSDVYPSPKLIPDNTFPKDSPQKYRLVPVDRPERMVDEEILKIFQNHGMTIELGATFSVRGQVAQLLNAVKTLMTPEDW